jgi:hypothetical protein
MACILQESFFLNNLLLKPVLNFYISKVFRAIVK